jgi:hypothetical protein
MAGDPDRTSRAIAGEKSVDAPTLELRLGEVMAIDLENDKLSVTIGGGDEVVTAVNHLSNYKAELHDTVWLLANGPDLLAIDRAPQQGPAIAAWFFNDYVTTEESRTSTAYGDLATVGPVTTLRMSPSGRALIWVSAVTSCSSSTGGAAIGFAITKGSDGTVVLAADDSRSMFQWKFGANKFFCATRAVMVEGIEPGDYRVTAKYRSFGGTATFSRRSVHSMPL